MRVLVCGGRKFADWRACWAALARLHEERKIAEIIHGGARGADALGGQWGEGMHIPVRVFPADWKTHGKAAGAIRNQQMLDEGKPDLALAFPGGRGTADMVRRAKAAGIETIEVE